MLYFVRGMRSDILRGTRPGLNSLIAVPMLLGVLLCVPGLNAQPHSPEEEPPYALDDESEVVLSGTLHAIQGDDFDLDYGDGVIRVELEQWDRDARELGLHKGQRITAYGEIDRDFFTATTVEAEALYIKSRNSFYYATKDTLLEAAYKQAHAWSEPNDYEISDMTLRGKVSSVDPKNQRFAIRTRGGGEILINTANLEHDPLSDDSSHPIQENQAVLVSGRIDYKFLKGKILIAEAVTALP